MKIYFAGSIRGGRDDAPLYMEIIRHLQNYGQVLTEHIGDKNLQSSGEEISVKTIHDRDMDWVRESNLVIAEVTTISMGVGYELGRSVEMKKKILALHRNVEGRRLSAMIAGSEGIIVKNYNNLEEAKEIIDEYVKNIKL